MTPFENRWVGGAVAGLERIILQLIAEQEFQLPARVAILSFIVEFGVVKGSRTTSVVRRTLWVANHFSSRISGWRGGQIRRTSAFSDQELHGFGETMSFALQGSTVLAHFARGEGTGLEYSNDDGLTWHGLDSLPQTFTHNIATAGTVLDAGGVDGLWRRPIDNISGVSALCLGSVKSLYAA